MQPAVKSAGGSLVAGAAIGLLVLSFAERTIPASQGKEDLEITGFVDRSNIKEGDRINFLVNLANTGPNPVKVDSVKTLFGSDEPCNLSAPLLPRNQTITATCQQSFEKEGKYNVGVLVQWTPLTKGATPQQIAKTIFQVTVLPQPWYAGINTRWYLLSIAVLLFILILTALASQYPYSQKLFLLFLLGSWVITFYGLMANNGTIVVAGLLSTLVSGVLVLKGKDFLTDLMDRITKAGPFEFSPLTIKAQDLQIFKMREVEFLKAGTTIDEILTLADKLEFYIEFLRLKAYSLETELIAFDPPVPPDEMVTTRKPWLVIISWGGQISRDVKDLKDLYDAIEKHETLKNLFNNELKTLLQSAKKLDEDTRKDTILDAVAKLEKRRATILIPQYFTTLARLHRILNNKEKALSILYEGHDQFRDSINTNVLLGWHIGEMNSNYSTALKYECRALEIALQCAKDVETNYQKVESALADPQNNFARHLRQKVREHKDCWHKKLSDWFTTFQMQMRNNVAYDIAVEGIAPLEALARKYADTVHAYKPEDATYTETLGLVKLRFSNSLTGGKDKDVKEALRLFEQAIYLARAQNDVVTLQMAQLHHEEAREMLRRM